MVKFILGAWYHMENSIPDWEVQLLPDLNNATFAALSVGATRLGGSRAPVASSGRSCRS